MRKNFFLFFSFTLFFTSIYGLEDAKTAQLPTKKLLVLSCRGGYGHLAATQTLSDLLQDNYCMEIVYPIDELRIWGIPSGESLYNTLLRNGWVRTLNFASQYIAPKIFSTRKEKLEYNIQKHIEEKKPDLIISVIPFINYPATEAARKSKIPYLLVTVDNDLQNWIHDFELISHPNFEVTIGSDLPSSRSLLVNHRIPADRIKTIGLPIRRSFATTKDRQSLLSEHRLSPEKPVVLIMMGGAGSVHAYKYAKELCEMNLPIQIIAIAGRSQDLYNKLKTLKPSENTSLLVLGFTEHVADLMSISNLLITKPGPGTINEAISMKLPLLIDRSAPPLFWEKANINLVKTHGVGEEITTHASLQSLLEKYLFDEGFRQKVADSFEKIPQNQFNLEITRIIENLIEASSLSERALAQVQSSGLTMLGN